MEEFFRKSGEVEEEVICSPQFLTKEILLAV